MRLDLSLATNILGSPWDDMATSPSFEATTDLNSAGVMPLAKSLLVDLSAIDGVPGKIEGLALVNAATIAIANDNDFDIGDFDANGRNVGKGTRSQILLISLPATPVTDSPEAIGSPTAGTPVSAAVEIRQFRYRPRQLEVSAGTTVIWTNRDGAAHTVSDLSHERFDSGRLSRNGQFRQTFLSPGRCTYECFYHQNMTGVVIVS